MNRTAKVNLSNIVAFQICWLAICFSAAAGQPLLGIAVSLVWLALHLYFLPEHRFADFVLFIAATLLGFSLDSLLVSSNVIEFPPHAQLGAPSTFWMAMLWGNMALTLRHSMAWLGKNIVLAAVLGAIGGCMAYYAGTKIGALIFPMGTTSAIAVGIQWLIAMPLLFWFARRLPNATAHA